MTETIDSQRIDCDDEKWRQARDRVETEMASDIFEAFFMGRRPSRDPFPVLADGCDFTPKWHDDGLTRDELNEKIDGVIVPIEPSDWAKRYVRALQEMKELQRRSPFPHLHFAAFSQTDSLTVHLLENSLDDCLRPDD